MDPTLRELFGGPPERALVTDLLPGTPGPLYVQELSGADKAAWIRGNVDDLATSDARLVVLSLVDQEGRRVLTREDVPALLGRSALVGKLAAVAAEVSALFWKPDLKNGLTTSRSNGPPGRAVALPANSSPA